MREKIRYRMNYDKAIEAIIWLAGKKPGIDIYHVVKIIFYADKMHINKYARPIIGDTYVCFDYGPLPSVIYDLLTENSWLGPEHLQRVNDSLNIERSPYPRIVAKRNPNMEYFSGTDLECFNKSFEEYIEKSFDELYNLTHNEKCYLETDLKQPIDYRLMVDEDNPLRDEIIKEISETSLYVRV